VRLARVVLGTGAWTDPVRVATEQAEAVVALAGFHVGDDRWRPLPGYLAAVDGRVTGMQGFGSVPSAEDIATGLYQDSMDTELARLEPQLQARLPLTDRDLSEIVHAVRWWQQARRQPPLAAILLHVRVLELLSQRLGVAKWYDYLDEYHRAFWIRRAMLHYLASLVDDCVRNYDHVAPGDQERVKELGRSMTAWQPGGRRTVDLTQALSALPELASLFPPHDRLGRSARSALARFTVPVLATWRDELANDWNLARDRLIRVRNSLAHGGPIEEEPADSVHGFARQLAGWSLAVALEGLLQGRGIEQAHATRQQNADQWNDTLLSASSVASALIDPALGPAPGGRCGQCRSGRPRHLPAEQHAGGGHRQWLLAAPAQRLQDVGGQLRAHHQRTAEVAQLAGIQHILKLAYPRRLSGRLARRAEPGHVQYDDAG
jgi:hypothetical protein